ncbi:putative bifunctional diguanylate cyclase/phosphodiesterase [Cellulomonas triticagri]|nr:bifunctional diguanylate cyclase/phosphodiesterase [Cellulomonas triticagri]
MPTSITGPRRRVTAPGPTLAAAAALVAVLALVERATGLPGLTAAGGVVAAATGGVVLRQQVQLRAVEERGLWRWCGWAVTAVAAGLTVEAVVDLAATGVAASWLRGAGLTVGGVVAVLCAYQGLLSWNRFRTSAAHPADWVNAVGSMLGTLALGVYLLAVSPLTTEGPGWALEGHLLRASALVVLAVTTLVVTVAGGLRDDPRAWLLTAGLVGMSAVELLTAPTAPVAVAPAPGLLVVLTWTALTLVTAAAGSVAPPTLRGHFASTQVVTICAMVAVVAGTGVLLLNGLRPSGSLLVPVLATAGVLGGCVRMTRTFSELAALAATRQEARTDPLTGVPNRRAMLEVVDRFAAARTGAALLVIDLDRFKDVNDRYGHAAGDVVIRTMSARLRSRLDGGGVLARFGGDEFAVVLDHHDVEQATTVAHALRAAVREPVDITGRVVRLDASIGVASTAFGDHRDGELLRWADTAMYAAKRDGGGVRVYDEAADARDRDEMTLADELRTMLTTQSCGHGDLELHYQPQLDCTDGRVVGMEALVRWRHPERGLLPPVAFIDLAEQTGSMFALTERVLGQAAAQAARWQGDGRDLAVAVNLSTSCLEHPRLLDTLDAVLADSGLRPEGLVVEITETTLMHDPRHAVAVTRAIADRGIGVSIDDYGSGYSSLTYLNELPAGELKLDRSFTARLTSDERTRAIVSGTLELAHHLGLRLIAEGVEDAATDDALRLMGCDRAQGYLHSRPMPVADADAWLRARDAATPAEVGDAAPAPTVPGTRRPASPSVGVPGPEDRADILPTPDGPDFPTATTVAPRPRGADLRT